MEELGRLGINFASLLTQIVTFVILLVVLRFTAYKPLMRMLDERSRRIKESVDYTEQVKEQAAHAEEEVKKRLEEAGKEGQELISKAARTGEEIRKKAAEEAKPEAEALIARARQEIERERDDAIAELRKEFTDLTITAAEKVIEQELDEKKHKELIEKVLDESLSRKD